MRSCENYQSIKTPDDLEEERSIEGIYQGLLREYDPDEGGFKAYQSWCRKRAREIYKARKEEEEND